MIIMTFASSYAFLAMWICLDIVRYTRGLPSHEAASRHVHGEM